MKSLSTKVVSFAALAATVFSLAACSKPGAPAASATTAAPAGGNAGDVAAIRAADAEMNNYLKLHALEGAVSYYTYEGVLMTPGMEPVNGANAIRDAFTDMMTAPGFALSFTADKIVVAQSGDLAYSIGKYSESGTNPKTHKVEHSTGSYVTVYKKTTAGKWKAVADITTPGPAKP